MHEMSLCLAMVDMAAEKIRAEGANRATRLKVAVGALGHVDADALAFCFDAASRGTPVAGAVLEIDRRPGRAFCFDCVQPVDIQARLDPCPLCGGVMLRIEGGDDLKLVEMEIS